MSEPAQSALDTARAILAKTPVIDGHNDLPWALREAGESPSGPVDIASRVDFTHTDLPRLRAGGVGAQFWSVYVPAELQGDSAVAATLEQIDLVHRMIASQPADLELAVSAADVTRIMAAGKIASLLGAEGGHSIAGSLGVLRAMHALGVRYLTLTHSRNVPWADSATDEPVLGGLSDFGREVVTEMQRIGMLVDLSHVSPGTMNDALDVATLPVIFSHSSARAITDHPRNVPDQVLERIPGNGGVVMITFVPPFVSSAFYEWHLAAKAEASRRGHDYQPGAGADQLGDWAERHVRPQATVRDVADHAEHVREVAGIDHIGIGGDFDGTNYLPVGLSDVSAYPVLFAELSDRGWTTADLGKLAGGNILRVLADSVDSVQASGDLGLACFSPSR